MSCCLPPLSPPRREQWPAQGVGRQAKTGVLHPLPDADLNILLGRDHVSGCGIGVGDEVRQKARTEAGVCAGSAGGSEGCCAVILPGPGVVVAAAGRKGAKEGREKDQGWRELQVSASDCSKMPKSVAKPIRHQGKPKVAGKQDRPAANSGGRRVERDVASSTEEQPCLEGDAMAFYSEHADRNRYQQAEVEDAVAGLCSLSVSLHSPPPARGRDHKGGRNARARDRKAGVRDGDCMAHPAAGGSGEQQQQDGSRRKGLRKQPGSEHAVYRAKNQVGEEAGAAGPSGAERKAGGRPAAGEEQGDVSAGQSGDAVKKGAGSGHRSRSVDRSSADADEDGGAGGGTGELKGDGAVWSSSDASTSRSSRSSTSSSSYEEDNDDQHDAEDDPEDDWETAADALCMHRNSGEGKGKGYLGDSLHHGGKDTMDKKSSGFSASGVQHGVVLKPEYKYKANGFGGRMRGNGGRAWRPDDVSRPPTLPRLTTQHSYPVQSAQGVWDPVHGSMWGGPPATPTYCPICTEELDITDSSFVPCSCGFRLCLFCHHRIASEDGRCPGCRKAYNSDVAMKLSRASSWLRK